MYETQPPTIYDIADERGDRSTAGTLRAAIAQAAVDHPGWTVTYDDMLAKFGDGPIRHPENFSLPGEASWAPVFLTAADVTIVDAADTMRAQAELLGVEAGTASDVDLVAAVAGAEVWFAAVAADDLAYAAAKGPDALASSAALLARACGDGVDLLPADPDWPTLAFALDGVLSACAHARAWSDIVLGPDLWPAVSARMATDLGWRAHGASRTHEASLLLGVRGADVSADWFDDPTA